MGTLPLLGAGPGSPSVAISSVTWNPADKNANITLSNGDLTAITELADFNGVRATTNTNLDKRYLELTVTTNISNTLIGMINSEANFLNDGYLLGQDPNGIGWVQDGRVLGNGVDISAGVPTFTSGDTCCISIDIPNGLIWCRTNGGVWNAGGGADPATGVGGVSFSSFIAAGPYYPALCLSSTLTLTTVNFGNTYTQAVPSGFIGWGI